MIEVSERHQTWFHVTGNRKPVQVGLFRPRDGDLSQSPAPRASELWLLQPNGMVELAFRSPETQGGDGPLIWSWKQLWEQGTKGAL